MTRGSTKEAVRANCATYAPPHKACAEQSTRRGGSCADEALARIARFRRMLPHRIRTRFLVVGSGVAGLHTAWRASDHDEVLLLTKGSLFESATAYAQGGIAAALGAGDSPELHRRDTLAAGAALCDAEAVHVLVEEGPARVRELHAAGSDFDLDPGGRFLLGREAAHSTNRFVHAH